MRRPLRVPEAHAPLLRTVQAGDRGAAGRATAECARCRRGVGSAGHGSPSRPALCGPCVERLRADLCHVLTLHEETERALVRTPASLRQRVSGSRSFGIVLDDDAVAVRSAIRALLLSWTRLVADERGVPAVTDTEVRGLLRYLVVHLEWLAGHPAGPDFADEVAELLASAGRGAAAEQAAPLGPCPQPGCGGTLRAPAAAAVPAAGQAPAARQVRCEYGHGVPPRQWFLLAERSRRGADGRRPAPAGAGRPGAAGAGVPAGER
ncbi:OvmZ protein [Streptomyces sp. CA2R106]|uniref:OvmZ protein n=1 Tax=Streptomyces sp. CA2R106 TaxID=3120153 RepID=UPI00300A81C8